MEEVQSNVTKNFNTFIDGIENQCAAKDFHIGVVATGTNKNPTDCQGAGDLILQNEGERCIPEDRNRTYLTHEDNIREDFTCLAKVGAYESSENQLYAIENAVNPDNGCNAGFLRDDALLVITLITDEDDASDAAAPGIPQRTPGEWSRLVQGHLGNNANRLIMTSIANPTASKNIIEFNRLLLATGNILDVNGYIGDVQEESYAPFFQRAVQHTNEACAQFNRTCPRGECCPPSQLLDKVLLLLAPLLMLGVGGLLLARLMERSAINDGKNALIGRHKGVSLAGLLSVITLAGVAYQLSGCFPTNMLVLVAVALVMWLIHFLYATFMLKG
jgi:hypothetical protein